MAQLTKRAFKHRIATSRGQRAAGVDLDAIQGYAGQREPAPGRFAQVNSRADLASQVPSDTDSPRPDGVALIGPKQELNKKKASLGASLPTIDGADASRYGRAMSNRLYRWVLCLAEGPGAVPALAVVAFAESSFFPIPPDVLLVPMVLAKPRLAWVYAAIATAGSVFGGAVGYALGALLYETLGAWLIHLYGYEGKAETLRAGFQHWGAWIILIKGLTPVPYKLVTIVAGLLGYSFGLFVLLSLITRGARFFLLSGLLLRFGGRVSDQLEKRFGATLASFLVVTGLGFWIATHVI